MTVYNKTIEETFDAADSGTGTAKFYKSIADAFDLEDYNQSSKMVRVANVGVEVLVDPPIRWARVANVQIEVVRSPYTYTFTVEETLDFEDYCQGGFVYYRENADEFDISAVLDWYRRIDYENEEGINLVDAVDKWVDFHSLADERLFIYDTIIFAWLKELADTFNLADLVEKIWAVPVNESMTVKDILVSQWKGVEITGSVLDAVDVPKLVQMFDDLLEDGMTLTDVSAYVLHLLVSETLVVTDAVVHIGDSQHILDEGLNMGDYAERSWDMAVEESLTATDSNLVKWLLMCTVEESLGVEGVVE